VSDSVPARRWLVALVAVVIGGAGVGVAQDKPADIRSSDTPARSGTLSDTKSELDAIRALRDPAMPSRVDPPRVGAPEWHGPSGGTPAPVLRPARPVPRETKGANWLVDAMQPAAKDRERAPGERNLSPLNSSRSDRLQDADDADRLRPGERPAEGSTRRETDRALDDRARDRSATVDPTTVINPLTRYLEDWMSPQDLALLAPGALQPGKPGVDTLAVPRPGAASTGALLPPGVGGEGFFGARPPAGGTLDPTPRENPFLQSLAPPPPGMAPGIPTSRPASPPPALTAPATALNPPPVAPPPPRARDFARPPNDEKYFKPLKRF
jgi:hypothetical protein